MHISMSFYQLTKQRQSDPWKCIHPGRLDSFPAYIRSLSWHFDLKEGLKNESSQNDEEAED